MPRITLQDGMNILEAAFDKARSLGLTVAVSIVDARGDLVATARMDNAIWWWTESSRGKAVATVAYEGVPSGELLERSSRPVAHGLQQMFHGRFMPQQGAMPVFKDGVLVGAVGTAGGSGEEDEEISAAGAAAVGQ